MKRLKFTKEEREILAAYDRGQLRSVKNLDEEIKRLQQYARNTLSKTRTINIRLSEPDLQKMKAIAVEKGLPYQTFIGSILHQYSSGKIKEVERDRV